MRRSLTKAERCAQLVFQARRRGFRLYDIPSAIRPQDLKEAYAAQSKLAQLLGGKRIGYKIANTNESSQKFLSLPEPFYGPLLESLTVGLVGTRDKPATIRGIAGKLNLRLCEPEFAFQVGDDGKIIAAAPAIEVVHSSFLDWKVVGAPSLVADLACNGAWIRGEAVPIEKVSLDSCVLRVNGKDFARGFASRVYGSPLKAFSKLLEQEFVELKKGDWVTTGVCVDPPYHYCAVGDRIEAEFNGGLGSVAIQCEK